MKELTLRDCESALEIDVSRLDDCLMEQPELFYACAKQYASAVAARDGLKYDLESAKSKHDQHERELAFKRDERVTEKLLDNRVEQINEVQQLSKKLLKAKQTMDEWDAIKDAYSQRSFMLRELVAWKLGELHSLSVERGSGKQQRDLNEGYADRAKKLRRQR